MKSFIKIVALALLLPITGWAAITVPWKLILHNQAGLPLTISEALPPSPQTGAPSLETSLASSNNKVVVKMGDTIQTTVNVTQSAAGIGQGTFLTFIYQANAGGAQDCKILVTGQPVFDKLGNLTRINSYSVDQGVTCSTASINATFGIVTKDIFLMANY